MDIEYTVQIWQEGNQFVAHAMPLDVMSAGPTPEQARRACPDSSAGSPRRLAEGTWFTPVPFREENLWDGIPEETNALLRQGLH